MAYSRRLKAFRLHAEDIESILAREAVPARGMPKTARVVRFAHEWMTNSAIIIMSDDSWDEVDEGHEIPVHNVAVDAFPPAEL